MYNTIGTWYSSKSRSINRFVSSDVRSAVERDKPDDRWVREKFVDLLALLREHNFDFAPVSRPWSSALERQKETEERGWGYSGWILLARGRKGEEGGSNDILTNPTSVRNFTGCLFPVPHWPPAPSLPVAVPLVERPYFFVPRNYSSQITGPGCAAENL